MSFRLNLELSLSDIHQRLKLPYRTGPYWETLSYGRSIGYERLGRHKTYWQARIRMRDGNYRRHRLGRTNDRNSADGKEYLCYQDALLAADRWFSAPHQTAVATDTFPVGVTDFTLSSPIGDIYTVGHAIRDYLEWKRVFAAHSHFMTLISYSNYHILPRLGTLPAEELNGAHIQKFSRDILTTPAKPGRTKPRPNRSITSLSADELRKRKKTINLVLGALRRAILMAWENGHIENDRSWRAIRNLPNIDKPRMLHLNREECRRLLEHCAPDLRDLVLAALYTGARVSELTRIEVCHFNREKGAIYFPPAKTKLFRLTYLPDEGYRFFERMTEGKVSDELVFRRANGNRWFTNYTYTLKQAAAAAGLPRDFSIHALRHTYASQLIQAGAPAIVVAHQLGHSTSTQVNKTYGHLAPQIREAEVRQRFVPVLPDGNEQLDEARPTYATIHDLGLTRDKPELF